MNWKRFFVRNMVIIGSFIFTAMIGNGSGCGINGGGPETVRKIIELRWETAKETDLDHYNFYYGHIDSPEVKLHQFKLWFNRNDTSFYWFVDSLHIGINQGWLTVTNKSDSTSKPSNVFYNVVKP